MQYVDYPIFRARSESDGKHYIYCKWTDGTFDYALETDFRQDAPRMYHMMRLADWHSDFETAQSNRRTATKQHWLNLVYQHKSLICASQC